MSEENRIQKNNENNLGLQLFGGRFFIAAYDARSESNGFEQVSTVFERELSHLLVSEFEIFLKKRIHSSEKVVLLAELIQDSYHSIMTGVDTACDLQYQRTRDLLSPRFESILQKSLEQTLSGVQKSVWKILAILSAKGADAVLGYMDRMRGQLLDQINQQELRVQEIEKSRKNLLSLLHDFSRRSVHSSRKFRGTIEEMEMKLSDMNGQHKSLQNELAAVRDTLRDTELMLDVIRLDHSRIVPQAHGYVAMETILANADTSLVGKTLSQKLKYLLEEMDRLKRIEKIQDTRVAEIHALRQQLDSLTLVTKGDDTYASQMEFLERLNQMDTEFYEGISRMMGIFFVGERHVPTDYIEKTEKEFHQIFFLFHALRSNASTYALRCIDTVKNSWKENKDAILTFLPPGSTVPDKFPRTHIEKAALECRRYIDEMFPSVRINPSPNPYAERGSPGEVIDVMVI